jgi:hypothetical protein
MSAAGPGGAPVVWAVGWNPQGRLAAVHDTHTFRQGPAALRVESVGGPAQGSAGTPLKLTGQPFRISGWVRSEGQLEECLVAIQAFDAAGKQVGWENLADGRGARDWTPFSRPVSLLATAARASVVVTFKGTGRVWLDELVVAAPVRVFKE